MDFKWRTESEHTFTTRLPAGFCILGFLTLVLLTTAADAGTDAAGGGDVVVMSVTWLNVVFSRMVRFVLRHIAH